MRRLMMGIVVVGIVLSAGLCSAQSDGPSAMPEKVHDFLDRSVGTWTFRVEDGEVEGTMAVRWGPGGTCVIQEGEAVVEGQHLPYASVWGWDGVSEDGIVAHRFSSATADSVRLTLGSGTVMKGEMTGIYFGKRYDATARYEIQSEDKHVFSMQGTAEGEEIHGSVVYTRLETTDDAQELIRLEDELARAFIERDMEVIDRINADGMSLGTSEGKFITKDDVLGYVRSDKFDVDSMACEDLRAKVYGDMAVVTGKIRWTDKKGGSGQELITDVFLKRDGRWQMVATHASEIEKTIDTAKLSAEMKKLAGFVGTWRYEGEQVDPPVAGLPYGGAGTFHGTNMQRFILGGRFLESTIEDNNPSGKTTVVTITGYDPKAGHYVANAFLSDGSRDTTTETVSADGRTWTRQTIMTTSAGQTVPVRSVTTISPDGTRITSTTEVSPDAGKTWKHWYKDKSRKISN